jgi:hypothetical protein
MAAFIAKRSLLASMQQLEALKNQSVLEALEGIEVKNDRPAAQTSEQANPLYEAAYPEPAMGKFADQCSGIPGTRQFARACHVSRPHAKMDNCCHRLQRLRKNSMSEGYGLRRSVPIRCGQSKTVFLACHKGSGAPSFAFLAKGGMPPLFTQSPSPQLLLIPPVAESAKDGAPDPLRQGEKYGFRSSLVFITSGERRLMGTHG